MTLAAATVWEVQTGGSDTNGGGFATGATGTDRSQGASAWATLSASSVVHTTTTQINVAVGDFTVSAADVGNILQVTGGTATAGFYQITTVDVGNNRWTVDRAVGTAGQTVVGAMGGALASPGKAGSAAVANNKLYIKSGTYTVTSATPNIAGGCVSWPASSGGSEGLIQGYGSARNDYGTRPTLVASGISTFTLVSLAGQKVRVENLIVDGATLTASKGIANATNVSGVAYLCKAQNCTAGGIGTEKAVRCEATGCSTTAAIGAVQAVACWSHDNTISGFNPSGTFGAANAFIDCIASNNTGATSDGFQSSATPTADIYTRCTAHGNGRDGFHSTNGSTNQDTYVNCLATSNGGYGFSTQGGSTNPGSLLLNCAGRANTPGNVNGTGAVNIGFIALSADPYVAAGSNNFALNTTAGGGAALRSAGYPGTFPGAATTGYADIGAAQHADAGGGVSRARVTNMGGV